MEIFEKLSGAAVKFFYALSVIVVLATIGFLIAAFTVSGWFWLGVIVGALVSTVSIFISVVGTHFRKAIKDDLTW